jgi:hypothetical protein
VHAIGATFIQMTITKLMAQVGASTFLWGSSSGAISLYLPAVLASADIIHFPNTVSTVLLTASLAILTPLGFARGILNGTETILVPAAGNIVAAELKHQNLDHLNSGTRAFHKHADQFDISSSLLSSSGFGTVSRGVLGMFMPSTEVLLEHVAKESSTNAGNQEFLNLLKGATNGLLAGQIMNARDKLTMLGLGVTGVIVVGTIVSDQAAGKMKQKKDEIISDAQEKKQEIINRKKDAMSRIDVKHEEMKSKMDGIVDASLGKFSSVMNKFGGKNKE